MDWLGAPLSDLGTLWENFGAILWVVLGYVWVIWGQLGRSAWGQSGGTLEHYRISGQFSPPNTRSGVMTCCCKALPSLTLASKLPQIIQWTFAAFCSWEPTRLYCLPRDKNPRGILIGHVPMGIRKAIPHGTCRGTSHMLQIPLWEFLGTPYGGWNFLAEFRWTFVIKFRWDCRHRLSC